MIWLNRDELKMYLVTCVNQDHHRRSALVLTEEGPIKAKVLGEQVLEGNCIKSQLVPEPLISPDQREIEEVIIGSSNVLKKSKKKLRLFRMILDIQGTKGWMYVWTTKDIRQAKDFARKTRPMDKLVGVTVVTTPIIYDQGEAALKSA